MQCALYSTSLSCGKAFVEAHKEWWLACKRVCIWMQILHVALLSQRWIMTRQKVYFCQRLLRQCATIFGRCLHSLLLLLLLLRDMHAVSVKPVHYTISLACFKRPVWLLYLPVACQILPIVAPVGMRLLSGRVVCQNAAGRLQTPSSSKLYLACVAAYSARAVQRSRPSIQGPQFCGHESRGHKGSLAALSPDDMLSSLSI